ncbi:hypothetical protein [Vibrio misgurnus]|uniref:hypothetical protein n=1 Tax=Vibrio misgurnus TaxID=2993714 RepID=UPI00241630AC|nr:hypothetical protein [Vibrio sp. gvc]
MSREKEPIHSSQSNHPTPVDKTTPPNESETAAAEAKDGIELTVSDINVDDEPEIKLTITDDVDDDDQLISNNKEKKRRGLTSKIALWAGLVTLIASGAGVTLYLIQSDKTSYLDFTNSDNGTSSISDQQLLRLNMEIDKLKGDMLNLASLPEQYRALNEQNELMKTTIEQLKNELRAEVEAFYANSKEREQRIAAIQSTLNKVINDHKGDRDELEKLRMELAQINEVQDTEIERIKNKMGTLKKLSDSQANLPIAPYIPAMNDGLYGAMGKLERESLSLR